jgi:hypothetical protein
VDVVKANAAMVGSDLRQMIAGAFAENGIVIAFPQRELHLDATRPVSVKLVPAPEPSSSQQSAGKPPAEPNSSDRKSATGLPSSPAPQLGGARSDAAPLP